MAQRVEIILEDDIDGGDADQTVRFALDGTQYELDLSNKNAKALRDAMSKYVQAARKTGRSGGPGSRRRSAGRSGGSTARDYDPKVVRAWAESQGIEVSQRGRVPLDLVARFQEANK